MRLAKIGAAACWHIRHVVMTDGRLAYAILYESRRCPVADQTYM